MKTKIEQLKDKIKTIQLNEASGHDWWHTLRVYNNAIAITNNTEIEFNKDIIEISAILHDVADHKFGYSDDDRKKIITDIFEELQLNFDILDAVVTIVNNISYSKNQELKSIEGKIVQDADRLDAIGFIGIARTFTYGGYVNRAIYIPQNEKEENEQDTLDHFEQKLFKLHSKMNTEMAKDIAINRTDKMRIFVEGFYNEWNGLE